MLVFAVVSLYIIVQDPLLRVSSRLKLNHFCCDSSLRSPNVFHKTRLKYGLLGLHGLDGIDGLHWLHNNNALSTRSTWPTWSTKPTKVAAPEYLRLVLLVTACSCSYHQRKPHLLWLIRNNLYFLHAPRIKCIVLKIARPSRSRLYE